MKLAGRTIGLLLIAAATASLLVASVAASSAMAESTALCSKDQSTCEVANLVKHVHETSVGKATLLTGFGTTECDALFLGDVKGEAQANPLVLSVTLTYSNCLLGKTKCTAAEEKGPAEVKVLKEGHETTKVTGEGLVHLVCGSSLDCSYNGTNMVGTGKGPLLSAQANGDVTTTGKVATKEAGGFLCPKESKLDVTLTPLSATYISS